MTEETTQDTIFCTVCQNAIPEARARRMTAVCSEKCKNKLDVIRERQRAVTKCPYCRHPASPEEREEFRLWRAERGDIRSAERQVRDHGLPQKRTIAQVLRKAVHGLRYMNVLGREELAALIAEAEAVLLVPEAPKSRKRSEIVRGVEAPAPRVDCAAESAVGDSLPEDARSASCEG